MKVDLIECDRCKRRAPATGDHYLAWATVEVQVHGHFPAKEFDLCPCCVKVATHFLETSPSKER